jgi:hypothetical protein
MTRDKWRSNWSKKGVNAGDVEAGGDKRGDETE